LIVCLGGALAAVAAGQEKTGTVQGVEAMKKTALRFRNEIEVGPGGKQIQLEDPDGNPVELFEPAR
jgi:hypothetical protein